MFNFNNIANLLNPSIVCALTILLGAVGEILTEKSGHLNLGIPGIMATGGISGVAAAFFYEQVPNRSPVLMIILPLLATLLGALLMGLVYCFLAVTLRANQNVTGLAITTFGIGIANFFGEWLTKKSNTGMSYVSIAKTSALFKTDIPGKDKLGDFGTLFLQQGFLIYPAVIIAVICGIVLKRTRVGLHLRAVGENPATADAAGINVSRYKYISTCIGSMIAGLGGFYYCIKQSGWANDSIAPYGWLAIALVIFAIWRPILAIPGAILFGILLELPSRISSFGVSIPLDGTNSIFSMLPYVVTIIVLIFISARKKRENQPPASLGLSYFREDR